MPMRTPKFGGGLRCQWGPQNWGDTEILMGTPILGGDTEIPMGTPILGGTEIPMGTPKLGGGTETPNGEPSIGGGLRSRWGPQYWGRGH